ncbi:TLC domain-containing protein 2 [Nymphaea thermarum]|nr:TLC domain-containing protein 2 [Nymphaea thermarum]
MLVALSRCLFPAASSLPRLPHNTTAAASCLSRLPPAAAYGVFLQPLRLAPAAASSPTAASCLSRLPPAAACVVFLQPLPHPLLQSPVVLILANEWMKKGIKEMFEHKQLVDSLWSGAYSALCFSCGYFAYDQWDMLHYRLYSGWIPSILLHHLVLLICFTLALYRNTTINYLILSLVCELHSIFLHLRKIRRMSGVRDGKMRVVQLEWVFNWLAFFTARLGCHVLITYKLIRDAHKFERGVALPLALTGMAGMNLLNFFLGRDLLKAYRRKQALIHGD